MARRSIGCPGLSRLIATPTPSLITPRPFSMAVQPPVRVQGQVVQGFGRGSKELGIPTANFSEEVIERLPTAMDTGIYYGWARIDQGDIYKMVMSVGWNPYYKNEKKSMETHIIHDFDEDFYGSWLRVIVSGYIRPEENYNCLDDLIHAIRNDIATAERELESPSQLLLKTDAFLTDPVDTNQS
eukprot:TCALIF_04140-PA protein Name:"Similar to Rfk Riboflavin kinase (Mus musculus)" AED:0.27 eAED:0.27 QI:0/0/0/0.6/1/1/5/0/183